MGVVLKAGVGMVHVGRLPRVPCPRPPSRPRPSWGARRRAWACRPAGLPRTPYLPLPLATTARYNRPAHVPHGGCMEEPEAFLPKVGGELRRLPDPFLLTTRNVLLAAVA